MPVIQNIEFYANAYVYPRKQIKYGSCIINIHYSATTKFPHKTLKLQLQ